MFVASSLWALLTYWSLLASRKRILISLEQITIAFVKLVAQKKEPKNEILIRNAIGKVFPYGSFLLGVYGPGSDIDTLIVAPKYVTRDDYFEHYPKLLMNMAPEGAITGLTAVSDAFVPIIKFEYWDISIDLNFSRIIQKQLDPNLNLQDNALLRGLDETELRSINGTRVATEMLSLIPEKSTFRMALRAIKLWAQRRAIYANIVGFPGGIAWAIMVARVCQLYPKATPAVIVNKFFLIISQWQWPQPVLLKSIESGPLPVRVWNPKVLQFSSPTIHCMFLTRVLLELQGRFVPYHARHHACVSFHVLDLQHWPVVHDSCPARAQARPGDLGGDTDGETAVA